jgi:formamidopyrimidine-DNA glycosylase
MPELPEVETIRRGLEGLIIGAEIVDVEVRLPKMVIGESQRLKGATFQRISRRGKGLILELDNGYSLAIHVKMTGQLIYKETKGKLRNLHPVLAAPEELPGKHTHVMFTLRAKGKPIRNASQRDAGRGQSEAYLFYNDIRQFGWIHIVPSVEAENLPFFKALGPEPLTDLTRQQFGTILGRSKAPIKQVLMDQSRLAGVGNIYANDALFRAKIHPRRPANTITKTEAKELFQAVEFVLTEGIKAGGASEENFVNALGEKGFYQEKFLVYKKTGTPCKRCGTPIERIVVGGRGTFLCPSCQV